MRPELVLFDCDGVLVDSERITVAVEARVLTSLGWPITADEVVRHWMGRAGSAQIAEVAERLGPAVAARYDVESTAEVHRAVTTELVEIDGISALVGRMHARARVRRWAGRRRRARRGGGRGVRAHVRGAGAAGAPARW